MEHLILSKSKLRTVPRTIEEMPRTSNCVYKATLPCCEVSLNISYKSPIFAGCSLKFKYKYASYLSTFIGSWSFIQSAKSAQWSVVFQGSVPLKKSGQMVLCETWNQVNFYIQVGRICGCLNLLMSLLYQSRIHVVTIWILFYSSHSGYQQSQKYMFFYEKKKQTQPHK